MFPDIFFLKFVEVNSVLPGHVHLTGSDRWRSRLSFKAFANVLDFDILVAVLENGQQKSIPL